MGRDVDECSVRAALGASVGAVLVLEVTGFFITSNRPPGGVLYGFTNQGRGGVFFC